MRRQCCILVIVEPGYSARFGLEKRPTSIEQRQPKQVTRQKEIYFSGFFVSQSTCATHPSLAHHVVVDWRFWQYVEFAPFVWGVHPRPFY